MSELALKCENNCAIFKQNYTLELPISFKISILSVLALLEIQKIQISSQKVFTTLTKEGLSRERKSRKERERAFEKVGWEMVPPLRESMNESTERDYNLKNKQKRREQVTV